ncbi:hypothetical protein Dimus_032454 [Dionaea muscipula]
MAACHHQSSADVAGDTSRKRAGQNADLFIHEEVLVEILARLPVKSLLRFKCVCKTWFFLIGSEYFAGKHLSTRSMMFKDYNFENLLVDYHQSHHGGDNTMRCLKFSAMDFDTLSVVHNKFKIISSSPEYRVSRRLPTCSFAGSCNGIVCLLVEDLDGQVTIQQSLLLWNPATGEVKALQHEKQIRVLGFGFDPKMNDYKVMLIRYSFMPEAIEHVSVYSSRSDSWKSLDRPHRSGFYPIVLLTCTTTSGGRMLNWLRSRFVISFDVSEEAFVKTPMPPGIECKCGRKYQNCRLIQNTFDEPCTIICFPNPLLIDNERKCACFDIQKIIHIWTLNEYGESGSWTKLRSLMMFDYVCHDLFVLWKGGREVLSEVKQHKYKPQLASDNQITQQRSLVRLNAWPCLAYTESLVSINGRYDGGRLLLDGPNRSVHDVEEDIDDSKKKQNYYSLVDDSTGRIISRFHMTKNASAGGGCTVVGSGFLPCCVIVCRSPVQGKSDAVLAVFGDVLAGILSVTSDM